MSDIKLQREPDANHTQLGKQPGEILFVLSGPSGVGKDKLIEHLRARDIDIRQVVTATTREPRSGEVDGEAYHFLTRETFDQWQMRGDLVESAEYAGKCYGTPVSSLRLAMKDGHDAVLKIEVQGAAQVKQRLPNAILVFLAPPTMADLEDRLRKRADTNPADLATRMARAKEEMKHLPEYDYAIVNHNGQIEDAVANFAAIITAERSRVERRVVTL